MKPEPAHARRHRLQRGATILEVMVAASVMLVALLGFAGTLVYSATANGVAHRRTSTTLLRGAIIDRLAVSQRSVLTGLVAGQWYVDSCYDQFSQLVGSNPGPGANFNYGAYTSGYACPAGTYYRAWLSVSNNNPTTPTNFTVNTYVERVDNGCTAALRYASVGCSAADLLLTD